MYVENEEIAGPLVKTGGYARVPYPKFSTEIWGAIGVITDALDGHERQEILDVLECVAQAFEAADGAEVEPANPAT